jgi:hypothetical protein
MIPRIKDENLRAFLLMLRRALLMIVNWIEVACEAYGVEAVYPGFDDVILHKRDIEAIAARVAALLDKKRHGGHDAR